MPGFMTVFRIWIFCFRDAGEVISSLHCFLALFMVVSFCIFHFSDGIRCMPR